MLVAVIVTIVASLFVDLNIHSYAVVVAVVALTSILFSLCGLINAVFANTFDDINIVPTFVLTPLTYLGVGVLFVGAIAGLLGHGVSSQSAGVCRECISLWHAGCERCQRGFCLRHDRRFYAGGLPLRSASAQNRQTPENLTQMAGVLGQAVAAPERYAPEVLEPIGRQISPAIACFGWDIWHAYELSWCIGDEVCHWVGWLAIPADSPATVESKSLKLYLNSLNFHSVWQIIRRGGEYDLCRYFSLCHWRHQCRSNACQ